MSWAEIKHAVNSTLGTNEFNTIDEIVKMQTENTYYEMVSAMADIIPDSNVLVVPPQKDVPFGEYQETNYQRAVLPYGIEGIGALAFYKCKNLKGVNIPSSVKEIQSAAFQESTIERLVIPNGVTTIPEEMCYGCQFLEGVSIPETVTSIGKNAFNACSKMKSIKIPDSVTSIGIRAFNACGFSPTVVIGNGVYEIGAYAFAYCGSLVRMFIPTSVKIIGRGMLAECVNFQDVYYAGTESEWEDVYKESANEVLTNATIHYNATLN